MSLDDGHDHERHQEAAEEVEVDQVGHVHHTGEDTVAGRKRTHIHHVTLLFYELSLSSILPPQALTWSLLFVFVGP